MERLTDTLARGLAGRGHEVTLVTTARQDGVVEAGEDGVRLLHLPGSSWRRYGRRWWDDSYARLRREHEAVPYDVVVSQSAGALGYLRQAREELGLPAAAVLHAAPLAPVLSAWRGARTPRGVAALGRQAVTLPPLLARWRSAAPAVGGWLAVTPEVAAASATAFGIPTASFTVVPPGVDVDRFRPDPDVGAASRQALGILPSAPVVVLATRLEVGKGVQVALDAAGMVRPRHPDLQVLVAGAGHHGVALRRRAERQGLGATVRFLGFVDHDRLPGVLAAGDVFVLPSVLSEGFPVSLVEAMATGLPVVATAGIGGSLTGAGTILAVGGGDARQLAAAVSRLLDDGELRAAMGAAGRRLVERRLSAGAIVVAMERTLMSLCREPAGGRA
jgi:glycosyltransferase involved in cell wall biosynthesis